MVGGDGRAYVLAPSFGAEGVDIFVLGQLDGMVKGLAEVSECGGGFGFDFAF
jgi:hypothetical protein